MTSSCFAVANPCQCECPLIQLDTIGTASRNQLYSSLATPSEAILSVKSFLTLLAVFVDNPVEVEAIDKGSHGITGGMSNQAFIQHFL